MRKGPLSVPGAGELPQQLPGSFRQSLRRQQVPLTPELMDQAPQIPRREGDAEHLPGGLRQFMCLVNDQRTVFRQQRPPSDAPVDGVRHEQIVVADLDLVSGRGAHLHKAEVPAALLPAVADLGHMDMFPVIPAEMLRHV